MNPSSTPPNSPTRGALGILRTISLECLPPSSLFLFLGYSSKAEPLCVCSEVSCVFTLWHKGGKEGQTIRTLESRLWQPRPEQPGSVFNWQRCPRTQAEYQRQGGVKGPRSVKGCISCSVQGLLTAAAVFLSAD